MSLLQPDFWEKFPLAPANEEMKASLDNLVRCTGSLETRPPEEALEKLQLEYATLFLGPDGGKAPPWESLYRTPERLLFGPPAGQVREAMRRFGVEVAAKYQVPEDHLGLELILLAAAAEAAAGQDGKVCGDHARAQLAFIEAHPLAWIADLERDAAAHSETGFYPAIIGLVRGVLLWDRELLGEYIGDAG